MLKTEGNPNFCRVLHDLIYRFKFTIKKYRNCVIWAESKMLGSLRRPTGDFEPVDCNLQTACADGGCCEYEDTGVALLGECVLLVPSKLQSNAPISQSPVDDYDQNGHKVNVEVFSGAVYSSVEYFGQVVAASHR